MSADSICTCEYISPGAAALHAAFHGVDGPLPKIRNLKCPIHGDVLSAEQVSLSMSANRRLPDPPGGYDIEAIARDLNAFLATAKPNIESLRRIITQQNEERLRIIAENEKNYNELLLRVVKTTQPDLVSKLREVLLTIKGFAMQTCNTETEMAVTLEQIRHVFYDNQESLLGREGQAVKSEFLRGLTAAADYVRQHDNLGNIAADEILGLVPPCGPSQPETAQQIDVTKAAFNEVTFRQADGTLHCAPLEPMIAQPSPSTPIVPGTAGLSAEQLQAADGLNAVLGAATPAERWTCPDCGYDSMPYPPKDYHICPKCMVEFGNDDRKSTLIEREARIRKDVLREAALHVPAAYRKGWDRFWIECTCGWNKDGVIATGILPNPTLWANHIRALAERPAPAGEVGNNAHRWKGDIPSNGSCCSCGWLCEGGQASTCRAEWETHIALAGEAKLCRWQCPHCAHVNLMISANCENCKIPLVNTAGEVKPAPGSVRRAENEAVRLIALLVNELSGKPAPENRIRLVIQDALDVAQGNEPPSR